MTPMGKSGVVGSVARASKKKTARIEDGRALCPVCGKTLCKLYYGAAATGVGLMCRGCKTEVFLDTAG